ncbi:class I SAM-dependent methyltransferase [Geomesophilobacter sediminis]|uniref:Class I SAM-dependent methyltransferase n=1 Tax=Geomesophilobacter sediminis TaxID=2798584 RepID=A0A8J7JC86_9BACT|nr:class I SAM-dependent methyltransferase [Geomesophilobacter sediminis]MBJ6724343.1 class I SAM-dependent methyltransferase [Geomesophilobacter sediminis]
MTVAISGTAGERVGHREHFNALADRWDVLCRHDAARVRRIVDVMKIAEGDRVLDVGTGTGILLPLLQDRVGASGRIDAVDIAERMLEVAASKHNVPNTSFVHGDILALPAQRRYNHVICYSVFPHFQDKARAVATLAEHLKEGGRLTVCHSQCREAINELHRKGSPAVAHDYLPGLEAMEKFFTAAGLVSLVSIDSSDLYLVSGKQPVRDAAASPR